LLDHLVWGAPRLDQAIERFEALTGVRAALGGRHPDEATHNALLRIGPAMYLELISPDPAQPPPEHPRWFGLDELTEPRLVTWAAKASGLEHHSNAKSGRRQTADGRLLSWRLTYPAMQPGDGLVPFLIDWGRGPHPAETAPDGLRLIELRAEHPDPAKIGRLLRELGVELRVGTGDRPALIAILDTPRGTLELR
jgi:hypothetical protein